MRTYLESRHMMWFETWHLFLKLRPDMQKNLSGEFCWNCQRRIRFLSEVNVAFPEMGLSDKFIGNKRETQWLKLPFFRSHGQSMRLNMSVGNGAAFDAHLDVSRPSLQTVAEAASGCSICIFWCANTGWSGWKAIQSQAFVFASVNQLKRGQEDVATRQL